MNVDDLEHFRNLLVEREESLNEWLDPSTPANQEDSRKVRSLLIQIKDALGRVENATFGNCTRCDGQVEMHRLEAQPVTQVCLDCYSDKERAHLEEELYLASKIHRALLPQKVEKIEGFEVAAKSLAARVVGGDYYDILPGINGGLVRIIIADSMGKGIPAGLVMSNLQGALRILADEIETPGSLIARLNQWLCRNIPVTNFISLACLALEPGSGNSSKVTLTNAGHPAPILVRDSGAIELLEATGTVIGVHEGFGYPERDLVLAPGDLMLLYTDGITEAENPQEEMFGEERLMEFVVSHRADSIETIIGDLLHEIQNFTKKPELDDDVTVIALRKKKS